MWRSCSTNSTLIGLALAVWLAMTCAAHAQTRRALVIGNDAYQHVDKLEKAKGDALAYAALLRRKGFEVSEGYDLDLANLQRTIADFVDSVQPGDTVAFIYSGHGWSDGAHNYLVGVDAPSRGNQELFARLSIPVRNGVDGVLDDLERKRAALKIAIIDACRDNPFMPPAGSRGFGLARGLKPEAVEGSFVIYSAGEGQSALDRVSDADKDPNSVFARTMLPLLEADLPLTDAIKTAQEQTHALAATVMHDQRPAYYDEVLGRACLSERCVSGAAAPPDPGADAAFAAVIDAAMSPEALAPLIAKLPPGALKDRAVARADQLKGTAVAKAEPPPPPVSSADPCEAGGESAMLAPVRNLFTSLQRRDLDLYASQWADDAVYVEGQSGRRRSKPEIVAAKQSQFARWRSVRVALNGPVVLSRAHNEAVLEDSYRLDIDSAGRQISDNARERYKVRCGADGRWLIVENFDYAP